MMAGPVQMFYCEGCAADVTKVLCNDVTLLDHSHIPNCSGPPPPNRVCQRDGRVFVSTNTSGDCQFEGQHYIDTIKCADLNNCFFPDPTSSSAVTPIGLQEATEDHTIPIVIGVVGSVLLLLLVLGLIAYFRKKRQTRRLNLEQQRDSGETEALQMEQRSGDTERGPQAVPGLDDGTSPSQCDSRV